MKIDQNIYQALRAMPVFKPEMRQANREGRKSQTRRVIEPQPHASWTRKYERYPWDDDVLRGSVLDPAFISHCKYGKAGDLVYMREPLVRNGAYAWYKDQNHPVISLVTGEMVKWRWKKDILTSIFMPKEAARSFYRYEFVRVERVQDISEEDAKAEGVLDICPDGVKDCRFWSHRNSYEILFNRINANRGYPWKSNPWVWVLGYSPSALAGGAE